MYYKNFLTTRICDWFIDLHKRNDDKIQVFNDRRVLRLYDVIEEENVKRLIGFMDKHISKAYPEKSFYVKNIEVVEWKAGQEMDWHRDYPFYNATSIIFLNDNFKGGELITALDPEEKLKYTRIIHPVKQEAVVSFLDTLWHKVTPVTKGTRYTLAAWYGTV